jgi:hypothetical protein
MEIHRAQRLRVLTLRQHVQVNYLDLTREKPQWIVAVAALCPNDIGFDGLRLSAWCMFLSETNLEN